MLACPLFRKFHESNKTAKLKGANIVGRFASGILWSKFAKLKGTEIISHVKLPTFRAAKLKGLH